jgi:glutathione S-transferase
MLELWGRKNANQVIQVLWALSELGVEYKRHSIGTKAGDLETKEYKSLNPNSKIPTIRDNGFVLWESHAVIRYLARQYGLGTLCPEDHQKAAISDQWMTWSTDSFMGTFFPVFWQLVRTEEKDRDYAKIAEMAQQSAGILKVLDDHLVSNNFVAGDQFTFGDIPLGVLLHKYFVLDIKRPQLTGIEAWYEKLKERPAFKEHAMQPFGNSPSEFFDLQTKGEQSS